MEDIALLESEAFKHCGSKKKLCTIVMKMSCLAAAESAKVTEEPSTTMNNQSWKIETEQCFKSGEVENVLVLLKHFRTSSASLDPLALSDLSLLYESFVLYLVRSMVKTCDKLLKLKPVAADDRVSIGTWVEARSPVRIDLAGGWTDTPPICYEAGGKVTGVAVSIDGEKPIVVRARCVTTHSISITLIDWKGHRKLVPINNVSDVMEYSNPVKGGALLKACLVYSKVVDENVDNDCSLSDYLQKVHGCGFEIESTSRLPEGSGMGTSSILAGAVLAALWTLRGVQFTHSDLIHGVLMVEQLMTTGGGWQDQVNGLLPGFKIGICEASESQVKVDAVQLDTSEDFCRTFESHLVLVYTGKVRLAKNLLQTLAFHLHFSQSVP